MSADARRQMVVDAGFSASGEAATIGDDEYTVVMGYDTPYEDADGNGHFVQYTISFKAAEVPSWSVGTTQITVGEGDDAETYTLQKAIDRNKYTVAIEATPV